MNQYILAFKFEGVEDENAEAFSQDVISYINELGALAVDNVQVSLTRVEEAVAEE